MPKGSNRLRRRRARRSMTPRTSRCWATARRSSTSRSMAPAPRVGQDLVGGQSQRPEAELNGECSVEQQLDEPHRQLHRGRRGLARGLASIALLVKKPNNREQRSAGTKSNLGSSGSLSYGVSGGAPARGNPLRFKTPGMRARPRRAGNGLRAPARDSAARGSLARRSDGLLETTARGDNNRPHVARRHVSIV